MTDRRKDFCKRWKIEEETSSQDEFKKFQTRVLNSYNWGGADGLLTEEQKFSFCQELGISFDDWSLFLIRNALKNVETLADFCYRLESLYSVAGENQEDLLNVLSGIIDISRVDLLLMARKGEIELLPTGEKLLDEEIVEVVLSFLDEKSDKHFVDALKSYQKKNAVKSAESLRRSLEEFLKSKLKNKKGLKKNLEGLGKKIKETGNAGQVRNIICKISGYLDDYFNEHSKHNDGEIDEAENEFLIYQVGLLMRYLHKIL